LRKGERSTPPFPCFERRKKFLVHHFLIVTPREQIREGGRRERPACIITFPEREEKEEREALWATGKSSTFPMGRRKGGTPIVYL